MRNSCFYFRFSFDAESLPGYAFGYVYTGVVTLAVVMYAAATDGLFVSFTINLVAHLQILQSSIKDNKFLKPDEEQHKELKGFIKYHNVILDLYNEVRDIYSPIVFGQFLMTSLQVCVIVYQMVKVSGKEFFFCKNIWFSKKRKKKMILSRQSF